MAAPNNPNTLAARTARAANARRRKLEAAAELLRDAGWTVLSPTALEEDLCGRNVCALAELSKPT